jgi:hypothetical protein
MTQMMARLHEIVVIRRSRALFTWITPSTPPLRLNTGT